MPGIENPKNLLAFIQIKDYVLQQLQSDLNYREINGFDTNATQYIQKCFC